MLNGHAVLRHRCDDRLVVFLKFLGVLQGHTVLGHSREHHLVVPPHLRGGVLQDHPVA